MDGSDRPIWFVGDLGDPGASAIASALPSGKVRSIDCPGDLPSAWPVVRADSPLGVILHRGILGTTDADRVSRLKTRLDASRPMILCVGPQVRYAETERWSPLVNLILPETLAAATIARYVQAIDPTFIPPPLVREANFPSISLSRTVAVVSTNFELRTTLASLLRSAGYEAVELVDLEDAAGPARMPTVWDVPVLESTWPSRLAAQAEVAPVVALIGFLDRGTARLARGSGAATCLDLPCDVADLVAAVDRMTGTRRDPGHVSPPPPMSGVGKAVGVTKR